MHVLEIAIAGPWNVFFLLALATGFVTARIHAKRMALPPAEWLALLALAVSAGVIGARVLHFDAAAPAGAKTIIGAVVFAVAALFAGTRLLRLDARAPDAFSMALPLGFAVGRIGCLLAGCCFGHVTDLPWGAVYDTQSGAFAMQLQAGIIDADAAAALPVHPVQLYEALLGLLAAAAVPHLRGRLRAPGSILLAVLVVMTSGRLLLEFFRARDAALYAGMTSVQWLLAAALAAVTLFLFTRERHVRRPASTPSAHVPAATSGRRLAAVASVPPLLLIAVGAQLAPLDRLALILFALPPLVACAMFLMRGAARTASTLATPAAIPCALLMLALQQPQGMVRPTDVREYPYSETSIGLGLARTEQREERVTGQEYYESSCDGSSGWRDVFGLFDVGRNIGGVSIARTTHTSPSTRSTIRLRGFVGSEQAVPAGPEPADDWSAIVGGAGGSLTVDRRIWGVTGGIALGTFSGDSAFGNVLPIGGIRLGRLDHVHLFADMNHVEPLGHPDAVRLGLGYGMNGGSAVRAGLAGEGTPFIGGTIAARGFQVEPSAVLGSDYEVRIGLTYTLPPRQR